MEVASPKRLARHALPVIMVVFGGLVLSGMLLGRYAVVDPNSETALVRGLTTQGLHVRPLRNGLAKFNFGPQAPTVQSEPTDNTLGLSSETLGRNAQLSLELQAALQP